MLVLSYDLLYLPVNSFKRHESKVPYLTNQYCIGERDDNTWSKKNQILTYMYIDSTAFLNNVWP